MASRSVRKKLIAIAVAVGFLFGALLILVPERAPRALAGPSDWDSAGGFFESPEGATNALSIPETMLRDKSLILWRSWSPATNGTTGTIKSKPFVAPKYMAVPFFRFPTDARDTRVYIDCGGSKTQEIAVHERGKAAMLLLATAALLATTAHLLAPERRPPDGLGRVLPSRFLPATPMAILAAGLAAIDSPAVSGLACRS